MVFHPHPSVWLVMMSLLAAYAAAVRYWGPQHTSPGEPPASTWQVRSFALGVAALWIGADWPVHEIAEEYLFSFHMGQHLIFSLVAAPLLLAGLPGWLVRRLVSPPPLMAVMRFLTKPLIATILFNGYLVFSHWPGFVEAAVHNEGLHFGAHFILVGTALLMWWPVLSPLPELPRLAPPGQMLYLFLQTIVPTVPASFLTFSQTTFYETYAQAERLFPALDPLTDQRLAGVVMKVGAGFLLWSIIAVLFFRWSAKEESGSPDAVDWQQLERRVNEIGSAK